MAKQERPGSSSATRAPEVDADDLVNLPGTGGPDDTGDVRVDTGELHLPRDRGAH